MLGIILHAGTVPRQEMLLPDCFHIMPTRGILHVELTVWNSVHTWPHCGVSL